MLAACTNELLPETVVEDAPESYTLVVTATKGNDDTTKALSLDGKTLTIEGTGSLTASSNGKAQALAVALKSVVAIFTSRAAPSMPREKRPVQGLDRAIMKTSPAAPSPSAARCTTTARTS